MSPLALSLRFLQAQPDGRLVALAREGHEPAFEALVRRYRNELLAYCRRLQPQSGAAEDALQQTLLQAWRALSAGAEVREIRPWLYVIARNVTLNHLRAVVAVPHELPDVAGGQELEQLVEQRRQARAALAVMASLPDLQRQVFMRATLDGASHDEVASALGLSSGAVRGLIYRARALVRSAAAAIVPNPVWSWAIRHAEVRPGGAPALAEAVGGGGAGVAAVLAKGGVVVTLAIAGAGGALLTHASSPHRHAHVPLVHASPVPSATPSATRIGGAAPRPARVGQAATAERTISGKAIGSAASGQPGGRVPKGTSPRRDQRESPGDSRGGVDGGGTERSRGGSDGHSPSAGSGSPAAAPPSTATVTTGDGDALGSTSNSSGSTTAGSSGSSGSSDGSSSGSSGSSVSTVSGTDGEASGGGSQITTVTATSDGTKSSDGGSSGSSDGSGSDGGTSTSGTH